MKVGQLRKVLANLSTAFDDAQLVVWLPGSKIDLSETFMTGLLLSKDREVLIEGNLRPGSALGE